MKSRLIFFLYIFLLSGQLCASVSFPFKKYQVSDGLSHNTVRSVIQDSYGFIWIGTSNGLNRYDGYRSHIYRNAEDDSLSLGNSSVSSLMEYNGDLWVGTSNGLYIYHRSTDDFSFFGKRTKYGVSVSCEITGTLKADNGLVWIATLGQGIFVYNPQTDVLKQHILQTSFAMGICQGADGRIYVSSAHKGIFVFDRSGYFLSSLSAITGETSEKKVTSMLSTAEGIWYGCGNTLKLYEWNIKTVTEWPAPSSVSILCIAEYTDGQLLAGTDDGLFLFGKYGNEWTKVEHTGRYATGGISVNTMMQDAEGTLWLGTDAGVDYMPRQLRRFESHAIPIAHTGADAINAFCEKDNGEVYIGSRSGLWLYNPQTQAMTECTAFSQRAGKRYDISALLCDGDRLWIGTHGDGLFRYNIKTGATRHYTHSDSRTKTLSDNDVLSLCKAHNGEIHIGTRMGLCTYNEKLDNFFVNIYVGAMTPVSKIYEDSRRNLWVATSSLGVFCQSFQDRHWRHYEHSGSQYAIPDNTVTSLFEDSNGVMWLGSNGSGLYCFSVETGDFVRSSPENASLQNATIYSMEEDRAGSFWIATDRGLYKIDRTDGNAHLFTVNDGLQSNRFVSGASLAASDGRLYFGGDNGFNAFIPEQVVMNTYIPPVYVTDIRFPNSGDESVSDESEAINGENTYFRKEIRLPYKMNSFTLDFAALSYCEPGRNQYRYMLKGLDQTWVRNTDGNSVSYNHLPPGEYIFMLEGSNNDGEWNRETASLKITVTPPWWRSPLAYIVYSLLLTGLISYAGYMWSRHVMRKYRRRMEEFNLAKEKEAYKMKVNFFVNLVHEIRTPLSLICLPLEKLMEKDSGDEYVAMIDKNVNYLLNITNQLLDFQKIESGGMQLNPKPYHLNVQLASIHEQFRNIAALKNIDLSLVLPQEDIHVTLDMDRIRTIIVNLLGNAIKYAESRICLKLEATDETVSILVDDDGCGIPEELQDKIFQPFYQIPGNSSSNGTGIGLAFSKTLAEAHNGTLSVRDTPSGGSSFILTIPRQDVAETGMTEESEPIEENSGESETGGEQHGGKVTLLLAEDNIELLEMTRNSMKPWYNVRCAKNGREAIEMLQKYDIDIIVSDVMMPEMDGMELCSRVKSDIGYSHIPVILLTAKTTLSSKMEGLENGADVYMEKPFSIRQLHRQIENLMALRSSFHRLISQETGESILDEPERFAISRKDAEFIRSLDAILGELLGDINYSIDLIADKFNMSRSCFHRKVKAVTGMTPNNYVMNYRLNLSARYLADGMRINEVALQLGFSTSSYFAKCFRQKFGILPKDYVRTMDTTTERT